MVARPSHSNKESEAVVLYAEKSGWRWRSMGHWGRLFYPHSDRDGCQIGVNGTPQNPENHAKQIKRAIDRCPHKNGDNDEDV